MREILFRGQRIDNGEWVYGSLITAIVSKKNKSINTFIKLQDAVETNLETFVVKPESIGQFTGLLDKSGNEIFENDRVLYDGVLGNVFYNKDLAMFMVRFDYTNSVYNFDNLDREIEIIGNIHEENK